jgi:glucose/arabinose dehydrogenase
MPPTVRLLLFSLLCLLFGGGCVGATDLDAIEVPPGFSISIYADNLADARSMALSPSGILFVGTRREGKVYALLDSNGDKRADKVFIIASGLNMPNGVAFRNGSLYVAEVNRLLRFDRIEEKLDDPGEPVVIYGDLPKDRLHGWKYLRFGPDGLLYVQVGAPCNICNPGDPYAALLRMRPDGSAREIFARGIRNTVGFDWHPETKELWFSDNGRDWLGDDLPPDELNRAPVPNLHFGFPYLHGSKVKDPEFGNQADDLILTPPAFEFHAHVAPLGIQFYTGTRFPQKYRNQLFVAQHGSWNRSVKIGYRVMAVFIDKNKVTGSEVFADGWLAGGRVSGRPVDLEMLPDGSLLVSDDMAGAIYRIAFRNPDIK